MRKRNLTDRRAMLFHLAYCSFRRAAHFVVELRPEMLARAAQAKLPQRLAENGAEILHGTRRGSRVQRIAPGQKAEQDCGVRDAARERADVIEGSRQRYDAKHTHPPEGGLQ